jgi:hypothetical protein
MRWTKPSAIVEALLILAAKEGAIGVRPLLVYAQQCCDTLVVKTPKKGEPFSNRFPTGDRGNVFLEYAWSCFNKAGIVMCEQDIMTAHHDGKIDRWYDSLTPRVSKKIEKPTAKVKDKKAVRRGFKKAKAKASREANKAKRIGDAIRAEAATARQRQRVYVEVCRAEEALLESLKAMLPKKSS